MLWSLSVDGQYKIERACDAVKLDFEAYKVRISLPTDTLYYSMIEKTPTASIVSYLLLLYKRRSILDLTRAIAALFLSPNKRKRTI